MTTIINKKSAIAGKVPALTDLSLGEIALNIADGKIFFKKTINGVESVVEIGSSIVGNSGNGTPSYATSLK